MYKKYFFWILFSPDLTSEQVKISKLKELKKIVEDNNGVLEKCGYCGISDLAYAINGMNRAHYVLATVAMKYDLDLNLRLENIKYNYHPKTNASSLRISVFSSKTDSLNDLKAEIGEYAELISS